MYSICKTFTFDAAHKLEHPYDGPCSVMHGHTYRVELTLTAEILNNCGMVYDFAHLAQFKHYISQKLDHGTVNDVIPQPTCENIARHLYDYAQSLLGMVESVRVWETPTSWGEYK